MSRSKFSSNTFIINADDFGMSEETNLGIITAFQKGILSSTCILANMPGFNHAIKNREEIKGLGTGGHLSLNMGKPVLSSSQVPLLVDEKGYFESSYIKHILKKKSKEYLSQLQHELSAQIEKLLDNGFKLDHINSQSHMHMIPEYYALFNGLCEKYNIPHLRITYEPFFEDKSNWSINRIKILLINTILHKKLFHKDHSSIKFKGLLYSNQMFLSVLQKYLQLNKPYPIELTVHPGYCLKSNLDDFQPWVRDFLMSPSREKELEALLAPSLKEWISKQNINLCTFSEIYLN